MFSDLPEKLAKLKKETKLLLILPSGGREQLLQLQQLRQSLFSCPLDHLLIDEWVSALALYKFIRSLLQNFALTQ
jgi:hypothetical protein